MEVEKIEDAQNAQAQPIDAQADAQNDTQANTQADAQTQNIEGAQDAQAQQEKPTIDTPAPIIAKEVKDPFGVVDKSKLQLPSIGKAGKADKAAAEMSAIIYVNIFELVVSNLCRIIAGAPSTDRYKLTTTERAEYQRVTATYFEEQNITLPKWVIFAGHSLVLTLNVGSRAFADRRTANIEKARAIQQAQAQAQQEQEQTQLETKPAKVSKSQSVESAIEETNLIDKRAVSALINEFPQPETLEELEVIPEILPNAKGGYQTRFQQRSADEIKNLGLSVTERGLYLYDRGGQRISNEQAATHEDAMPSAFFHAARVYAQQRGHNTATVNNFLNRLSVALFKKRGKLLKIK